MFVTVVTPPTVWPVTLAEAKAQCRVDGSDEDDLLNGLISAATNYVEDYTGRTYAAATLRLTVDAFADAISLPRGPVAAVSSVLYSDTAGVEQTASASLYTLDQSDPAWLVRNSDATWPDTLDGVNAVRITYTVGGTVPASVKHAIKLLIGDWYRGRENTALGTNQPTEMPHAVTALLANNRSFSF